MPTESLLTCQRCLLEMGYSLWWTRYGASAPIRKILSSRIGMILDWYNFWTNYEVKCLIKYLCGWGWRIHGWGLGQPIELLDLQSLSLARVSTLRWSSISPNRGYICRFLKWGDFRSMWLKCTFVRLAWTVLVKATIRVSACRFVIVVKPWLSQWHSNFKSSNSVKIFLSCSISWERKFGDNSRKKAFYCIFWKIELKISVRYNSTKARRFLNFWVCFIFIYLCL